MISIFRADAFGGFDFNGDERFAPGRAFKGGPNAHLEFQDGGIIKIPNMWACLVDVAACVNIIERLSGNLDYVEAINLVHIHELCHACDDKNASRYDDNESNHTNKWGEVLIPLSRIETKKRITK